MTIEIPVCSVGGCDTEVPGLNDGLEHHRKGLVCNDCWEYNQDHCHFPDEEPRHQVCVACLREEDRIKSENA